MATTWIRAANQAPPPNSDVVALAPILDKNGNYRQIPILATYTSYRDDNRYETAASYFRTVTYFLPFNKNVLLEPEEGHLQFKQLPSKSANPGDTDGESETPTYVVRMELEGRTTFSTATYSNGMWHNNAGKLTHVTHVAKLPKVPPMPEEYI